MWRIFTRVIQCEFDQIPNLKNCITTPNKNLGGEGGLRQINTCRHVPLLVNFFEKLGFGVWCLYRYLVHGKNDRGRAGNQISSYCFISSSFLSGN